MTNKEKQYAKATTIFRQLILNIIVPVVLAIIALAIYNNYSRTTAFKKFYHEKNNLVSYFIENTLHQQDIALEIEEDNLDKRLEILSDSLINYYMIGANVDSLNLFEIRESLGMDPNQEDIYIIDNGVIVNTTYPPDLNLNFYDFGEDFKQYLENVQLADSFKSEKFSIEMSTKKLRKYTYQPTKDGRYIVQLGVYSVRANEVISSTNEILLDISKENPAILDVDLFIGADPPFSFDSSAEMELDSALIDRAFRSTKSLAKDTTIDGKALNYEYVYMKRENTELYKGAVIRIISDHTQDKEFVRRSLWNSVLIFLVTITIVIVLIYKKSKVITNPIKKLLNNVNRITAGNLNERADVGRG